MYYMFIIQVTINNHQKKIGDEKYKEKQINSELEFKDKQLKTLCQQLIIYKQHFEYLTKANATLEKRLIEKEKEIKDQNIVISLLEKRLNGHGYQINDSQEIIELRKMLKENELFRLEEQNEFNKMLKLKSEEISCLNQELNTMKTNMESDKLQLENISRLKVEKIKDYELVKQSSYAEELKRNSEEISALKRELSTIKLNIKEYDFNVNEAINLEIQKNKKENEPDERSRYIYIKELKRNSEEISDLKEQLHIMKEIMEEQWLKNESTIKNYIHLSQENMVLKNECKTTFETIKYEVIMFKKAYMTLKSYLIKILEKLKIDMTHDDQTLKTIEKNKVLQEALGKINQPLTYYQ